MKFLKHIASGILLVSLLYFSSGCASTQKIFGKKASAESKAKSNVEHVESQIGVNLQAKLDEAANLTYGVGYALSKEENPSEAVDVAKELNSRVASLTGAPTIDEMKRMKQLIDDLTSQLATERVRGAKALEAKDNEVYSIQLESKLLEMAKDKEIQKYMKLAQETALKADATLAELQEYRGWFGLKAVGKGLWQFLKSAAWILGIGSILFLILRFAAATNPIAASIFGIFNVIGSWLINIIKILAPKALEVAGQVERGVANEYKTIMTKLIDSIEATKIRQETIIAATPNVSQNVSTVGNLPVVTGMTALSSELSKTLNTNEKAVISKIKRDIGYTG